MIISFLLRVALTVFAISELLSLHYLQPRLTFDQNDLYPDIVSKAAALCFSLIMNHPFIDGNKRIGHAAMETFLILNGYEIDATTDDQEQIILDLAAGKITRQVFATWLKNHIRQITIV